LSHHPEPSGRYIRGQHGRRFVLLRANSQAAEGVISHLCKQERKRSTPVQRRLSRTHVVHSRMVSADVGDENTESRSVVKLFQYCEAVPILADQHLSRDLMRLRCGSKERNPLVW